VETIQRCPRNGDQVNSSTEDFQFSTTVNRWEGVLEK